MSSRRTASADATDTATPSVSASARPSRTVSATLSPSSEFVRSAYTVDGAAFADDSLCSTGGRCATLLVALQSAAGAARANRVNEDVVITVVADGTNIAVPPLGVSELTPSLTIVAGGANPVVLEFDPDAIKDALALGDCMLTVRGALFTLRNVTLTLKAGARAPACGVGFAAAFATLDNVAAVGLPTSVALFRTLPCAPTIVAPNVSLSVVGPLVTLRQVAVRASATPVLVLAGANLAACWNTRGGVTSLTFSVSEFNATDARGARFFDARGLNGTSSVGLSAVGLVLGNVGNASSPSGALVAGPSGLATIMIANATISGLVAPGTGAIALSNANTVTMTNARFTNVRGGVLSANIATISAGAGVTMSSCAFANVSGSATGGAVVISSTGAATPCITIRIADTTFANVSSIVNGGAISIASATACFTGSMVATVVGATAAGNGGAVSIDAPKLETFSLQLTASNTSAGGFGGAVFVFGSTDTAGALPLTISGAFADVRSNQSGGALYVVAANAAVKNLVISRASCSAAACVGGALAVFAKDASLSSVSASDCWATQVGGALFLAAGSFSIIGLSLARAVAPAGGGAAIFSALDGGSPGSRASSFANVSITACTATGGPAAPRMVSSSSNVALFSGLILPSSVSSSEPSAIAGGGGVLLATVSSSVQLAELGLLQRAGVAWTSPNTGIPTELNLRNITVSNCSSASSGGGAIDILAVYSSTAGVLTRNLGLTLSSGTFFNNSATASGGAIRANGKVIDATASATKVTVLSTTFSSNKGASGGAVALEKISTGVLLSGCSLLDNTATLSGSGGGAIALTASLLGIGASYTLDTCTFVGNVALGLGGGAWFDGQVNIFATRSTFAANSAAAGGALALSSVSSLTLLNLVALANLATGMGSSIEGASALPADIVLGGGAIFLLPYLNNGVVIIGGVVDVPFLTGAVSAATAAAAARGVEGTIRSAAVFDPAVPSVQAYAANFSFSALTALLLDNIRASANTTTVFAINGATRGLGGDFKLDVLGANLFSVTGLLSVSSWASTGGSLALSSFTSATFSSCTWFYAAAGGRALTPTEKNSGGVYDAQSDTTITPTSFFGNGGTLVLYPRSYGRVAFTNSSIKYAYAHYGAGLWLQNAILCPMDSNVLSCKFEVTNTVDTSGLVSSSNHAAIAGGNVFVDLGPSSFITANPFSQSSADAWGPDVATGQRRAALINNSEVLNDTIAELTWDGSQKKPAINLTLLVVGGAASAVPLLTFSIEDDVGNRCTSDNTTVCTVSATRNDSTPLPLGFAPTYTASRGIVAITPFSVASGPGDRGFLRVSCTTADTSRLLLGSSMRRTLGLLAQQSAVEWTVTASSLQCLVPSASPNVIRFPSPLTMRVFDQATRNTVAMPALPCSIVPDSSAGDGVPVVLLGQTQMTTSQGLASFSIGIQGPPNITAALYVACTWSTGQPLVTARLLVRTCPIIVAMGVAANSSFVSLASSSVNDALLPLRESWAVTAPPSGISSDALQPLAPPPALVLLTVLAPGTGGAGAALALEVAVRAALGLRSNAVVAWRGLDPSRLRLVTEGPPVSCSLASTSATQWPSPAAQAAWAAGVTAGVGAALVSLPSSDANAAWLTSGFSLNAFVVGAYSNATAAVVAGATQTGALTFSRVGFFNINPNDFVALSASCTWMTGGDALTSTALIARAPAFQLRWLVAPPASALPSSSSSRDTNPAPGTFLGLSTTPSVQLWALGAGASGLDTFALTSFALTCTLSLIDPTGLRNLVGVPVVRMNATSGVAAWPNMAITGKSGATVVLVGASPHAGTWRAAHNQRHSPENPSFYYARPLPEQRGATGSAR